MLVSDRDPPPGHSPPRPRLPPAWASSTPCAAWRSAASSRSTGVQASVFRQFVSRPSTAGAQVVASRWRLRHNRVGPLEWPWRTLTRGRSADRYRWRR
ncbi:DUF418 domain-containing protein [Methylobacterium sp. DB0501]|nr:DUF418 domain-containing protein [Methylobacterium sp. DB0501]